MHVYVYVIDEAHLGVLVSLLKRHVDQTTGRAPLLVTNEAVLQDAIGTSSFSTIVHPLLIHCFF